ncbi:hypothetical protein D3C75_935470 [compost metagenome]
MQPLADLAGGVEGATGFNLAHQLHQVRPGDVFQRACANARDQIVLQVELGLVGGTVCPARRVVGEPLPCKRFKCQSIHLLRLSGGLSFLRWVFAL